MDPNKYAASKKAAGLRQTKASRKRKGSSDDPPPKKRVGYSLRSGNKPNAVEPTKQAKRTYTPKPTLGPKTRKDDKKDEKRLAELTEKYYEEPTFGLTPSMVLNIADQNWTEEFIIGAWKKYPTMNLARRSKRPQAKKKKPPKKAEKASESNVAAKTKKKEKPDLEHAHETISVKQEKKVLVLSTLGEFIDDWYAKLCNARIQDKLCSLTKLREQIGLTKTKFQRYRILFCLRFASKLAFDAHIASGNFRKIGEVTHQNNSALRTVLKKSWDAKKEGIEMFYSIFGKEWTKDLIDNIPAE